MRLELETSLFILLIFLPWNKKKKKYIHVWGITILSRCHVRSDTYNIYEHIIGLNYIEQPLFKGLFACAYLYEIEKKL